MHGEDRHQQRQRRQQPQHGDEHKALLGVISRSGADRHRHHDPPRLPLPFTALLSLFWASFLLLFSASSSSDFPAGASTCTGVTVDTASTRSLVVSRTVSRIATGSLSASCQSS